MGGGQEPGERVSSGPHKGVGTAAAGVPGRAAPRRRGGGPGLRQAGRGARRASTRPGHGGAGPARRGPRPGTGLAMAAPASADSEGAAPSPSGPGRRPAWSSRGPSLRPPPHFPRRRRLCAVPASSLGLLPACVPSAPSSRPPAPAPAAPGPYPHPFPLWVPAGSQPLPQAAPPSLLTSRPVAFLAGAAVGSSLGCL